jgi:DNA-binding Lrp family transcriptional regulator
MPVVLKPQDIVVTLRLCLPDGADLSYSALAQALVMSPSEVHAAVKRAARAGLVSADGARKTRRQALLELLQHGVRYVFPPDRGGETRGFPTAAAAPALQAHFPQGYLIPPVWPHPGGPARGVALEPLYRTVPDAVQRNADLYELLALVDLIRIGGARERRVAGDLLRARLSQ